MSYMYIRISGTDENTNADVSMAERPYFHYVESFDVYQNKSRADVLFDNLLNDQHKQDNPPVRRRIIPPIPVKKGHTYKRNERSTKQTGKFNFKYSGLIFVSFESIL